MSEDFELYNQQSCFIHISISIFTETHMTAPSGRYQSKLFNLFSKSINQLTKLQPHLRRIKSGAVWGTQVLFYLAHRLMQSLAAWRSEAPRLTAGTDVRGAALPAASAPALVHSNPVSVCADQPIQQLLLTTEKIVLIGQSGSSSLDKLPIQGVATQLMTRTLVLVTTGNQLLDLTPQQQKLLRQRIIWLIFSYGVSTRLTQASRLLGWPKVSQALPFGRPKLLSGLNLPVLGHLRLRLPQSSLRTVNPSQRRLATAPSALEMDELSLAALVRRALAYFLRRRFWQPLPAFFQPVANQTLIEGELSAAEPWLSWSDLFGAVGPNAISAGTAAIAVTTEQPSQAATSQTVLESCVAVDEHWLDIETDAILMGYVKHPLEQVLEWLDRVMTWLEGIVLTLWTRLRPHARVRQWIQWR